ncbi:HPP family protein [Parendozoicomonas haliclonae]|uniref:HPP family protein n=1 Tax=Parendozoicomonas haliclonae TaxID=1960125 RepID=A0A1X7AQV2_9GAMM|nr:HPP family protein [Parendozoicomonas haliclonae]SMA50615.1 HPP family protein [Parendozoicomonas haliclonae]
MKESRLLKAVISAVGAALCIWTLAAVDHSFSGNWLLMAPFGATMVLIFGVHHSPLAQPKNVVFGHLITAAVGLLFVNTLAVTPLTLGIAVGFGLFLMLLLDVPHPPAGGNPLLLMMGGHHDWMFLLHPVLLGSVATVILATCYHRLIPGHIYPYKMEEPKL